jgi:hypothetical protein
MGMNGDKSSISVFFTLANPAIIRYDRDQRPETRDQRPETRDQRPETRAIAAF